jgi:hypothetical protein
MVVVPTCDPYASKAPINQSLFEHETSTREPMIDFYASTINTLLETSFIYQQNLTQIKVIS